MCVIDQPDPTRLSANQCLQRPIDRSRFVFTGEKRAADFIPTCSIPHVRAQGEAACRDKIIRLTHSYVMVKVAICQKTGF